MRRYIWIGLALSACALPPPETDVELGRNVAKGVEQQIGLYDSAELTSYVGSVARRVERQLTKSPFRYEYSVLDQFEPNAFAAPGGFVYISRGLLTLARNEDEIAAVLGHEIVHVEHRHTAQQIHRPSLAGVLGMPGRVVGGVVSSNLGRMINAPIDALGALGQASYSRGHESESDEVGQKLAAAAGYDPAALASILDRMERFVESATGEKRKPTFFDSHPATPDRVSNVTARAEKIAAAPRSPDALDDRAFLQRLDGMVFGENPAQGVFREELFLHPDLDVVLEFPSGWKTLNTASLVGAISPREDAMVFYGIAGEGGVEDAQRFARKVRDRLRDEAGLSPSRDEEVEFHDDTGHLLVYDDRSGRETVHLFLLWLARDGLVHQFIGLGPDSARPTLRDTVASLRPLTGNERDSIMVDRIHVVEARDGETLSALGSRTKNVLKSEITALINGLDEGATLTAGQPVKIVVRQHYP